MKMNDDKGEKRLVMDELQRLKMLQELTEADGLPSFEDDVRGIFKKYLQEISELDKDGLGSIIAKREGLAGGPRIMLAGHMDEIGFMVKSITEKGFIKFVSLGGWWGHTVLAQRVRIKGRDGDVVGVVGSKPPHILSDKERKNVIEIKDMFIDVGAKDKEEVESFGVLPGDPILPDSPFTLLKNKRLMMAKAWDDRIGVALIIDLFHELQQMKHPNVVYGVGTSQEEVGLRGAKTSAAKIDPHVGIALDVGIAMDTPGIEKDNILSSMGSGPAIVLKDGSHLPNRKLRDLLFETAKEENIPYQLELIERGGTDAGSIHLNRIGVPTVAICIPTRYIHSHSSLLSLDDYENTLKLLKAVIVKLDERTVKDLVE